MNKETEIRKVKNSEIRGVGETIALENVVQAWAELTSGTGKLPAQDPLKVLLLSTVRVLDQDNRGVAAIEALEFLLARDLTEQELQCVMERCHGEVRSRPTSRNLRTVRNNDPDSYSKIVTPVKVSLDTISMSEKPLLEALVRTFNELRTASGKPPKEDAIKMIILCAMREAGAYGLTSLDVMERFLCRELTEEEEDYVIVATEGPAGHA